jgi:hypothetical protein
MEQSRSWQQEVSASTCQQWKKQAAAAGLGVDSRAVPVRSAASKRSRSLVVIGDLLS